MNWVTFGVQWLHVLLGIVWFGYSLSLAIFVIPAISSLPLTTQRQIGVALAKRGTPIITALVPVIVALGFIRGTFLGPIHSVTDVFTTAYGITWLVALVAAIATYAWGRLVIVPSIDALNASPQTAEGGRSPEYEANLERAKRVTGLELLGFAIIFTCMILMRFGL